MLIVVTAIACGLMVNRLAPPNLRVWGSVGRRLSLRIVDVLVYALPHLLALTTAVLLLYATEPRPLNRQIRTETGWIVCAVAAMSSCILAAWIGIWLATDTFYESARYAPYAYLDGVAFSVLSCRLTLAFAGHHEGTQSWYDWGGRMLGWLWIAAAIVKYAGNPLRKLLE